MSPPNTEKVFDQGLQPERTFLAWQRTVLALGVSCAVAVRFTAPHFGAVAVVAGIGGMGLALAAYVGARFRYRRTHLALTQAAQTPTNQAPTAQEPTTQAPMAQKPTPADALHSVSAWPIAAMAASTLLLGVLATLFLWGGIRL
ncbi:DUF202 domain-containing protein [Leifsonia sp. YAF41]|uniref:DUF202 domain-containing protein n=1 Tax=Leifsonia sp. YAF41 TaxID=3233086 RepID=UPI003F9CF799